MHPNLFQPRRRSPINTGGRPDESHLNLRRRTHAPTSPPSRFKRILVRVELEPAEITALMRRGYLLAKDKENVAEIEAAASAFIVDALVTP